MQWYVFVPLHFKPLKLVQLGELPNSFDIIRHYRSFTNHGDGEAIFCRFIDALVVDENHRGKMLGSLLLEQVEREAKKMGASLSHLDTFDWQGKDFYLRAGYEIFGVLEDCPPGH